MSDVLLPSRQVGDFTITAISDGYLAANLDSLSNIDPAEASLLQAEAGVQEPSSVHINCYLVRGGGRTILIDSGAGGFKQWGGRLRTRLPLAGVAPADIHTILLTHAHPDHIGGLIDGSGEIAFPQAELVVNQREVAFWEDDGNLSHASERASGNFRIARRVFDGYRSRLRMFEGGEVVPGIRSMPLPGHTEGHTGYLLESGAQSLLVWGDIVHFPHIQIARPDVSIAFDQAPATAAATRSRILELASSGQLIVAGMHLGESGFASIGRENGNYHLVANS